MDTEWTFRNEIFISDTFIILLPSLNINFTNVSKSKGRIRRIVRGSGYWFSRRAKRTISPRSCEVNASITSSRALWRTNFLLSFNNMSILLVYFITEIVLLVVWVGTGLPLPNFIWYIFYDFHSRFVSFALSLSRLYYITYTFFMAFYSSSIWSVCSHYFNKLYF